MTDDTVLSTDNINDDQDTADRSVKAIRIVADAITALGETGSIKPTSGNERVLPIAWGWFAYVVRSAELIALGFEHGLRHETSPNSRVIVQHTLVLQWLSETGNTGVDVVEKGADIDVAKLAKELTDSNWELPAGWTLASLPAAPAKGGKLHEEYDNFKETVKLYDDGEKLYVPYKLQSSYIHPSLVGSRVYTDPDQPGQLTLYAATDTFANLVDATRCVIQAALVMAGLLDGDTILTTAAAEAQQAWGAPVVLWSRK